MSTIAITRSLKNLIDENLKLLSKQSLNLAVGGAVSVKPPKWRWGGKELDFFFYQALALYMSSKKEIVFNRSLLIELFNEAAKMEIMDDYFKLLRHLIAEEYWHCLQDRQGYLRNRKDMSKDEIVWIEKEAKKMAGELTGVSQERFTEILYRISGFETISPEEEELELF